MSAASTHPTIKAWSPAEGQVRADRKVLGKALTVAKHAWRGGTTLPALRQVHLSTEQDRLTITSTDLDVELQATMPGWSSTGLDAFVNRIGLSRDLSALEGDTVEIATVGTDGRWVNRLAGGLVTIRRAAPDSDGFPTPQDGPPRTAAHRWSPEDVDRAVWVSTAASNDEGRPVLTGVHLADGWAAATDSYRLHAAPVPTAAPVLLPARVIALLGQHARNCDVHLAANDTRLRVWWSKHDIDWQLTVTPIRGTFPSWPKLLDPYMPEKVNADLPIRPVAAAARRHERIHGTASSNAPAVFERGPQGGLSLRSRYGDVEVDEQVDDVNWPEGLPIALRPDFFAATAGGFPTGLVHLVVTDPLKPIFLTDGNCKALVMPMRTS